MRFIGSKDQLAPFIADVVRRHVGKADQFVGDLFCGTASVSRLFKELGFKVLANDNLRLCYVLAQATLAISCAPSFDRLLRGGLPKRQRTTLFVTPYDQVLDYLNSLPGSEGFFSREYAPGGTEAGPFRRRYFTDSNARRIDAIRTTISEWRAVELIDDAEECLLLADLMRATNRVANIAGTYGCFIKHWDPRAHKALRLRPSLITPSIHKHEVLCMDANVLAKERHFDVLYLDPPYTWRHYGAYYHILETIAAGDAPAVTGRTGLRPWEDSKSRYCDRSDSINALRELTLNLDADHVFLSYSSEGLIQYDDILTILSARGEPICYEISHRRYRSNSGGTKANRVKERLYYVRIQ